jgi:hypothetical protein
MIIINRTKKELTRQLKHVHSLVYKTHFKKRVRILSLFLILPVLVTAIFWILPDSNSIIIIKGVGFFIAIIFTFVALINLIWIGYKLYAYWNWCKAYIKSNRGSNNIVSLGINEQGLNVVSDTYTTEVTWDHFKYYDEDAVTIYLFEPEKSMYSCWSFSVDEIGYEAVELIKTSVKDRLQKLVV